MGIEVFSRFVCILVKDHWKIGKKDGLHSYFGCFTMTFERSASMKNIKFLVATNPSLYGSQADAQDAQEFATFAHQYLQKHGYDQVEIEFVDEYPPGSADTQADIRKEIWAAFKPQHA